MTTQYDLLYNSNRIEIFSGREKFCRKSRDFYKIYRQKGLKKLIFSVCFVLKNGLNKPKKRCFNRRWGKLSDDEIISGFVSELRRGTVVLGVLNQLSSPKYGYSLGQELTEKGVPVDGNTLYPLLRRLESQGLLKSEWDMSEGKPRKYYVRTAKGTKINAQLRDYWIETVVNISTLMKEE